MVFLAETRNSSTTRRRLVVIPINLFHSLVVTQIAELLVVIACFFSIRIKLLRVPAILILISMVIDLFSNQLLEPEVKDFVTATTLAQDPVAFIKGLQLTVDSIGELLNILAVGGLIVTVRRYQLHSAPKCAPQR